MRVATVLALSGALLIGSIAATEPAVAGTADGHAVVAKKKKCKKGKKGRKKCKKHGPIFKLLARRSLNGTLPNSSPTPAGSERYDFCPNGTYSYRKLDYAGDTYFTTTYRGVWRVVSSAGNSGGLAGAIQYSVTNFASTFADGSPAESSPPVLLTQAITFGPFGVNFAGNVFVFGRAAC